MMTPRATPQSSSTASSVNPALARLEASAKTPVRGGDPDKAEKRREKKSYYAKLKKDEDDKMAELAAKYRDRAKERRDGGESEAHDASSSGYRAVAPDIRQNHDAEERRRQMIQESKYLGGDMEHTHLVKGLDFALLQKVRSEIIHREEVADEDEDEDNDDDEEDIEEEKGEMKESRKVRRARERGERIEKEKQKEKEKEKEKELDKKKQEEEVQIECRTILAKNLIRTVFKPDNDRVHELFLPGRMAYVMELDEEGESDIPTTIIRSKKDVAQLEQKATISTNDIVINKLTQILSYLRAGTRSKKKKKDKAGVANPQTHMKGEDLPIYDDLKEYKPIKKEGNRDDRKDRKEDYRDLRRDRDDDRRRDRERDRRENDRRVRDKRDKSDSGWSEKRQTGSYFDKPLDEDKDKEHKSAFSNEDKQMIKAMMKKEEEKSKQSDEKKLSLMSQNVGYAECYPGLEEMVDAIDDSDEEADYNKMDMGNKKGPVGRWDFDTPEEYADYMGSKEAMPKAAFQYGMKMSDGRKNGKNGKIGQKNEKAKLDKEWNQISALIDKRKNTGGSGGSSNKKGKYD